MEIPRFPGALPQRLLTGAMGKVPRVALRGQILSEPVDLLDSVRTAEALYFQRVAGDSGGVEFEYLFTSRVAPGSKFCSALVLLSPRVHGNATINAAFAIILLGIHRNARDEGLVERMGRSTGVDQEYLEA
jgi:hypothetical protein